MAINRQGYFLLLAGEIEEGGGDLAFIQSSNKGSEYCSKVVTH